jgi:hypothetical protein
MNASATRARAERLVWILLLVCDVVVVAVRYLELTP